MRGQKRTDKGRETDASRTSDPHLDHGIGPFLDRGLEPSVADRGQQDVIQAAGETRRKEETVAHKSTGRRTQSKR